MATEDDGPRPSLTAIVPCNDLDRSEEFYRRLAFRRGPSRLVRG
jgi:hypothetical protein